MPTILIVDDEKNIRTLYERELEDAGYEVETAASAPEALQRIRERRPDLVVLDVRMPGMDGLEALGRILAQDPKIPVILNSAYSSYQDSFLSWAADCYVVKSSDLTELKDAIRRHL